MTDLKPCPFCGGDAEIIYRESAARPPNWDKSFVQCRRCEAESNWEETIEQAITAWNTRHSPVTPVEEGIKLLKRRAKECRCIAELIKQRGYDTIYAEDQILAWGSMSAKIEKAIKALEGCL